LDTQPCQTPYARAASPGGTASAIPR
jgi:hypothetical protein